MKKDKTYFSKKKQRKIVEAIENAEMYTSGEIRVHIASNSSKDHLKEAIALFQSLEMHQTKQRNAVLFHICIPDKNFTVIGDFGIDQATPPNFWDEIKDTVIHFFKQEKYTKGIIAGIHMTGLALKTYFPYEDDDINELPNDITFS